MVILIFYVLVLDMVISVGEASIFFYFSSFSLHRGAGSGSMGEEEGNG